jgi:hypothetical protein
MADINVERKGGGGGLGKLLPLLLGLLLLGALAWWLLGRGDDEVETVAPVAETVEPAPVAPAVPAPTAPAAAVVPVAAIIAAPAGYIGQAQTGTVRVAEVVSDRGFWIEEGGQRMFAVVAEPQNTEQQLNINAGQMVQLSGTVYNQERIGEIPGQIEAQTREIIQSQPAFLYVLPRDVKIMQAEGGAATPPAP